MGRRTAGIKIAVFQFLVVCLVAITSCTNTPKQSKLDHTSAAGVKDTVLTKLPEKVIKYGVDVSGLSYTTHRIKRNQFLADILLNQNVSYPQIDALVKQAKPHFDFRKFKSGQTYHLAVDTISDSLSVLKHFIYEINPLHYIIINFNDSIEVFPGKKEVEIRRMHVGGQINSSLYQTLADVGANPALLYQLIDIYAWTVDFYRVQKGDWFKVVYDENFVDNQSIGIAKVHGASFYHMGDTLHSIWFNQDSISADYFDEKGLSLRKSFLKSPIKFSRISSRYTKRRFHPVQKRYKAHLGTDYAAPKGTPIKAVGDGTVIEAKYGVYNGRYVKIRHNSTYTTQYLHMSRIGKGMRPGVRVKQGDVIGYVGSTGLATGPHVCFRFWKNGKQVDHLREKFPAAEPVKVGNKEAYQVVLDDMLTKLEKIELSN